MSVTRDKLREMDAGTRVFTNGQVLSIYDAAFLAGARAMQEAAAEMIGGDGGRVIPLASIFAGLVSGNNMPCMSGDARDRLQPHVRRQFDAAVTALVDHILALSPSTILKEQDDA